MALFGDLRYALRVLQRTPAVTVPAIASLALGIAVNTTMFTVVDALLLRPVGSSESDALVRIGRSINGDASFRSVSYDEFEFLQRHATSFSDLAGNEISSLFLSGAEGAQFVSAEIVTSNYFRALKTGLAIGRTFDEKAIDDRSVVIGEQIWRRRFGQDPAIAGRKLSLNNRPFTIVGVAPAGFTGTFPGVATEVWLPVVRAEKTDRTDPRALDSVDVIGVLKSGISTAAARAELEALSRRLSELNSKRDPSRTLVIADARGIHPGLARHIGPFVLALMAVVGVVLLIVCANVSGLLLARATARRGEIAVRLAIGASSGRVITQLMVESVVLALGGATAGVVLSWWAAQAINAWTLIPGPTGTPVFLDLGIDRRVMAFTVAVTMITTVAFGLLPAVQSTRIDLLSALKDPQSAPGRRRSLLRGALVIVQVAVSVVLLVGAVLLFRSVRNSARIDLGFDPDEVGVVSFNLQSLGYDRAKSERFYDELLRRVRALPRVEKAALATFVPMAGAGAPITVVNPHRTLPSGFDQVSAAYNRVSDDYFVTINQPIVRGREFTARDRAPATPLVAIVNEAMARRFWPDDDPIGKRIRIVAEAGDPGTERAIVGVAKDAKYGSFAAEVGPFLFMPALEGFGRAETLHVRASSDPSAVLPEIVEVARGIDGLAAPKISQTMREAMSFALVPALITQTVVSVAAVIALLLAAGGLYGMVCYSLQQRLKEIGLRVALGATREHVFKLIVGGTLRLTIIGAAAGLVIAAVAMRLLSWLLIGLSPTDPLTFAGAAALMIVVALSAGYGAARKGLAIDPAVILKHE